MTEMALAARRAYKRKWAQDHPDKVKEYQERYWTKRAEAGEPQQPAGQPSEGLKHDR